MTVISKHLEHDRLTELRERLELAVARVCPAWLDPEAVVDVVLGRLLEREGTRLAHRDTAYVYRVAHGLLAHEIRALRDAAVGGQPSSLGVAIAGCLDQLEVHRARAVTLYLLGHTVPETGLLLGFDTKRAEALVHRGLADLRACLAEKGLAP